VSAPRGEPQMRGKLSVSVDDAAEMTGLSRSSLYERMQVGELPFIKLGARRLILVSDLLALLAAHRSEPAAPLVAAQ
jgi:excisionase family DNA binding protein